MGPGPLAGSKTWRVYLQDPSDPDDFVAVSAEYEHKHQAEEALECIVPLLERFAERAG